MIWRFNFTSYEKLLHMDLILLRMDLILLRMENDAAIYPLHFENPKFCKTNPPFLVYYI